MPLRKSLLAAGVTTSIALAGAAAAQASYAQQQVVDRATLAVQDLVNGDQGQDVSSVLQSARAVIVCPRVFRGGFILGGSGGDCVLLARDGGGAWSSPAFYGLGSGSVGLQVGIQNAQVLMAIMNDRALDAVLNSQIKVGADAAISIAHMGAGLGGGVTAAAGADVVTFARSRGLFAGLAIEGAILSARPDWHGAYYGRDVSPRQVVINMEAHNPGSDPLRAALIAGGQRHAAPASVQPGSPSRGSQTHRTEIQDTLPSAPAVPPAGSISVEPLAPLR